jgi:hypothetical protein
MLGVAPTVAWLLGCPAVARVRVVAMAVSSLAALVADRLRAGPGLAPATSHHA